MRKARDTTDSGNPEIEQMARSLLRLQRGLTGDRSLIGTDYMDDPELSEVYRLFYLPVSRAQALRAFSSSGIKPESILDMGSGSGAFSDAAYSLGARDFFLIDSSDRALDAAKKTLEDHGAVTVRTMKTNLESPLDLPECQFDCVCFGHSLNELWKADPDRVSKRSALLARCASVLKPGGTLVVVEPSTLSSGRDALAVRDSLQKLGWKIIAPCTIDGPCPALAAGLEQTCRDEIGWDPPDIVRDLAKRARLDKDSLKMTWFAARPPQTQNPETAKPSVKNAYRVVSDPLLNKAGRIRYLLCGAQGRSGFSASTRDDNARANGFFDLKRGDLIAVEAPELRERGWGFGPETRIRHLSMEEYHGT